MKPYALRNILRYVSITGSVFSVTLIAGDLKAPDAAESGNM